MKNSHSGFSRRLKTHQRMERATGNLSLHFVGNESQIVVMEFCDRITAVTLTLGPPFHYTLEREQRFHPAFHENDS